VVIDKNEIIPLLNDYIDSNALYEETVKEIARLERKKKTVEQDSVKGSMPTWPYTAKNFHISGIMYTPGDASRLEREEETLKERARITGENKMKVEKYMNRIPARMQRIIKYKLFEGLSWEDTAAKIGRNSTGEGIRKEFQRFMEQE